MGHFKSGHAWVTSNIRTPNPVNLISPPISCRPFTQHSLISVLLFLSTLTHNKVTHNSLVLAMASVGQTRPLDTPWQTETHKSGWPNLQNTNLYVGLFQTGSYSPERRQYSRPLLWGMGITSSNNYRGPQFSSYKPLITESCIVRW